MRRFDFLRSAVLAASLIASFGGVGTAFADTTQTHEAQHARQPSIASPYDSPDFVLDESNIHS